MVAGQASPLDNSSTEMLGLQLYVEVRRSSMTRLLQEPTTRHWNGDLVVGQDAALLFANLDTGRWEFESPWHLRMRLRRRPNPSSGVTRAIVPQMVTDDAAIKAQARRRWRPYLPSVPTHAFALQSRGSRYVYLGTTRPGPYGWGSGAFGRRVHVDCNIQPPVSHELWQELRSHRLEINGQTIEHGPDGKPLWPGTLGEVLQPLRRRRRAEARIFRRGLGEIIYSKAGRSRVLRYNDSGGHTSEARAAWEQAAHDALFLFWVEGFLSPWLDWL